MTGAPKIVVLGMMTRIPVAGVVWQTLHYLEGFRRLGFDVHYVESHARTPSMLMAHQGDDSSALAAAFLDRTLSGFGFGDRWAYVALHDHGGCYGMTASALERLYASAELVLNLHGGTLPLEEHAVSGRLLYLETDPVQLQVELQGGYEPTLAFLEPHHAFFTFAENLGLPGCRLPVSDRFRFHPTRQPVVLDWWTPEPLTDGTFTTVANWRQPWRDVALDGELYHWSKHLEFSKIMDLPRCTGGRFELALSGHEPGDEQTLAEHGWAVSDALVLSSNLDDYRAFIRGSGAEFTVAKDQNVRLKTGWFSDRSATYLAAGRPVVTQDTGFDVALPTGDGLFAWSTFEEAAAAVERVAAARDRHARSARELAAEHFAAERVLGAMLDHVGVRPPNAPRTRPPMALRADLELEPVSRRPTTLPPETVKVIDALDIGRLPARPLGDSPEITIVVVTRNGLPFTRLCLESILAHTDEPRFELVVVDNASTDGTREYVAELAVRFGAVRGVFNAANAGFPAAVNQALECTAGRAFVMANNDVLVAPGWLDALVRHLADPSVGLVGPVTNRIGTAAEVDVAYRTVGGFVEEAAERLRVAAGRSFEIDLPAMFCVALSRETWADVGPLDERFGIGTLEDDDYARRVRDSGRRAICAEDVLVHHFGEASFGALYADGTRSELLERNRRLYAEKWGEAWQPYRRMSSQRYGAMKRRIGELVQTAVPDDGPLIVVSKGDEDLVRLNGRTAWHFPQTADGVWAGHHPGSSDEAIERLEALRRRGGHYLLVPGTSRWWLEHYGALRAHLERSSGPIVDEEACVVYRLEERP